MKKNKKLEIRRQTQSFKNLKEFMEKKQSSNCIKIDLIKNKLIVLILK